MPTVLWKLSAVSPISPLGPVCRKYESGSGSGPDRTTSGQHVPIDTPFIQSRYMRKYSKVFAAKP